MTKYTVQIRLPGGTSLIRSVYAGSEANALCEAIGKLQGLGYNPRCIDVSIRSL